MKKIIIAAMLVAFLAPVVHAESDGWARSQVRKQATQISTLNAQVEALKVLVQDLRTKNTSLEHEIQKNYKLIQNIVSIMARQNKSGSAQTGAQAPKKGDSNYQE